MGPSIQTKDCDILVEKFSEQLVSCFRTRYMRARPSHRLAATKDEARLGQTAMKAYELIALLRSPRGSVWSNDKNV